jgi:hypothetical protein
MLVPRRPSCCPPHPGPRPPLHTYIHTHIHIHIHTYTNTRKRNTGKRNTSKQSKKYRAGNIFFGVPHSHIYQYMLCLYVMLTWSEYFREEVCLHSTQEHVGIRHTQRAALPICVYMYMCIGGMGMVYIFILLGV